MKLLFKVCGDLPQIICGAWLSLYVISHWLPHHLLQNSLFFLWLKVALKDSDCVSGRLKIII